VIELQSDISGGLRFTPGDDVLFAIRQESREQDVAQISTLVRVRAPGRRISWCAMQVVIANDQALAPEDSPRALNMEAVLTNRGREARPIRERNLRAEFEHFHTHDAERAAQRFAHELGERLVDERRCYRVFQIMPSGTGNVAARPSVTAVAAGAGLGWRQRLRRRRRQGTPRRRQAKRPVRSAGLLLDSYAARGPSATRSTRPTTRTRREQRPSTSPAILAGAFGGRDQAKELSLASDGNRTSDCRRISREVARRGAVASEIRPEAPRRQNSVLHGEGTRVRNGLGHRLESRSFIA
jgi:hypothetical protein